MKKINEHNHNQDLKIQSNRLTIKALNEKFDHFISNDFIHLRKMVNWLFGIGIAGLLIPIFLKLYF